jgi:hypothetical protein
MRVAQMTSTEGLNAHNIGCLFPIVTEVSLLDGDYYVVAIPEDSDVYSMEGNLITESMMLLSKEKAREIK